MATATTTSKARKSPRKILNLATAHVADGALNSPRSIREVLGQSRSSYETDDIRIYRRHLDAMPLHQLQEHAQKLGVLPAMNKEQTIRRLEEAFVKEHSNNRVYTPPTGDLPEMGLKERAEAIMRRERI